MKKILTIVILLVLVLAAILFFRGGDSELKSQQDQSENSSNTLKEITGQLDDVTKGEEVRGIFTSSDTSGLASAILAESGYSLSAEFEGLPTPNGDDFYEGWVVRRGANFSVKSTGQLELEDQASGSYLNTFESSQDLIDHDFYVLTLEPNDGDPAPADHILEGVMK